MLLDYGAASHLLAWAIGGIAILGFTGTVLAFWGMGRQGHRKD
ncbi:MAG: hypothetical protein QM611_10300 [Microbacterium sp.]